MQKIPELKTLLNDLYFEFMAESAWCAHCYGFENMADHYAALLKHLHKTEEKHLTTAYQNAVDEYERILADDSLKFMDPETTKQLKIYEKEFLDALAHAAQVVNDKYNVDKELVFH